MPSRRRSIRPPDACTLRSARPAPPLRAPPAAAVLGGPAAGVTGEMRRQAKAVNFGLIYGMSPFGLSRSTGMTLAEAETFVKAYFDRFPGVRRFLDEVRAQAARLGFVETLLGRRRYFPQLMAGGAPAAAVARARP